MNSPDEMATGPEFDATPEESRAAEWVAARRNPDWNEAQQAELDNWLAKSVANRVAYVRMDATWRRTDRIAALRKPMRDVPQAAQSRRGRWVRLAGFIGITAAVFGALAANYLQAPRSQLIETPKGGREQVTLADGSQIELNTDTAIRVNIRTAARAVELVRGEAYFQIKHDSTRPFVVTAGAQHIVDLGTKFLVRMLPDAVNVSLVEGKARLDSAGSQHPTVLSPGDVAVATAYSTKVTRKSSHALSESLAWQNGNVVFHNEAMADAVTELNRYGGPQLVVADKDAGKLAINGTFLTNNADEFAGIAHELFGLRVEHRNGNIILSR